ncbi:hypothetical protein [Nonomuraea gerenzanensis]|uniref:hypothetical protein n=1 Tax=Nonomuraea gerenzanensis TaxID=93944 RepID=UPI001CDA1F7E|nr:hypothetical protein [Nonomuraea gerenzanensis]UBU12883.1 hypothetical protein LCN96_52990 [Nonomuraea gerenzanensis]
MENWIDQPIVDPAVPERDRHRLAAAWPSAQDGRLGGGVPARLLGRPEPEPPRWVRRLFGLGGLCAAVSGSVLGLAAFETGHETTGLAAMMIFLTGVLFVGVSRPNPVERLARLYAGRYVVPSELDDPALDLLARARRAIRDVTGSRVHRLGLLDAVANDVVLPERLWEIARLVRVHTGLRAEQALALTEVVTPELTAVLGPQQEALRRSVAAVTERVWELEAYASRVRSADSALRASELQQSNDTYLDLLAQTGEEEGVRALSDQADALTRTLREAIAAGETL